MALINEIEHKQIQFRANVHSKSSNYSTLTCLLECSGKVPTNDENGKKDECRPEQLKKECRLHEDEERIKTQNEKIIRRRQNYQKAGDCDLPAVDGEVEFCVLIKDAIA